MFMFNPKSSPCTPSKGGNESNLFFLWMYHELLSKLPKRLNSSKIDLTSPFGGEEARASNGRRNGDKGGGAILTDNNHLPDFYSKRNHELF